MTHTHFLRIKSLKGQGIVKVAAKHNLREIVAEIGVQKGGHIDPDLCHNNVILRGSTTAAGVSQAAQFLMDQAGITSLRKNAVRALEIIFSLPPMLPINQAHFFEAATVWAQGYFDVPILSAVIHHDEAAPHCHVLLLPLVKGRMKGSELLGNRAKLLAMQADFFTKVGQGYGLKRQAPEHRHSATIRRAAVNIAANHLQATSGLSGDLARVLVEAHLPNPEALIIALGLTMPAPESTPKNTAFQVKTIPPINPIGNVKPKPIGIKPRIEAAPIQSLSCVGNGLPNALETSPNNLKDDDLENDFERERDQEHQARYWDETRGEFVKHNGVKPNDFVFCEG